MPQPSLANEGQIEENGGDNAATDEQWLEAVCSNIRYVGYMLIWVHRRIVRAVGAVSRNARSIEVDFCYLLANHFPSDEHCQ